MKQVKVLMLKTASGPKGNFLADRVYFIDTKLANDWVKKPNPACKLIDNKPKAEINFNWVRCVNFGSFKAIEQPTVSTPKPRPKFRPGNKGKK